MNKKYHIRQKVFLGLDKDERDYVIAVVEDARERNVTDNDSSEYAEISLHIGDWRHEVEFYFEIETPEERENSLHKIRQLSEVIDAFKRAIESEIEVINAGEPIPRLARVASVVH